MKGLKNSITIGCLEAFNFQRAIDETFQLPNGETINIKYSADTSVSFPSSFRITPQAVRHVDFTKGRYEFKLSNGAIVIADTSLPFAQSRGKRAQANSKETVK
jgi:hypothetical protein